MASAYGLAVFFGEENRLVKRGEMAWSWQASHLTSFEYDGTLGRCSAKVHASMKDKEYNVEVRILQLMTTSLAAIFLNF